MTPIQKRCLFQVEFFQLVRGYSPTVREVAFGIGRSVGATHNILQSLRAAGEVEWEDGHKRTLRAAERVAS